MTRAKTRTTRTVIQLLLYLLPLRNQLKQQKQRLQQLCWQVRDVHQLGHRVYAHATLLFHASLLSPQLWAVILGTSTSRLRKRPVVDVGGTGWWSSYRALLTQASGLPLDS